MHLKKSLLVSLLAVFPMAVFSQIGGRTSFDFLRLSPNARMAALGGENVSLYGRDVNTFLYNPASLNEEMDKQLGVNYLPFYGGVKKASMVYAAPIRGNTWGFAVDFMDYGEQASTEINGVQTGTFHPREYAMSVTRSHRIGHYSVGGSFRFAGSHFESYNAFAAMADIGGMFHHPKRDFQVGLVFRNVGFVFDDYSKTSSSNTPLDVQLGLSYKLEHLPLRFNLTAHNLHRWDIQYLDPNRSFSFDSDGEKVPDEKSVTEQIARHLVFGAEFDFSDNFNLRMGYNHLRRKEMGVASTSAMSGFSFGGMLRIKRFNFEYSRAFYYVAGGVNVLSLTMNLGEQIKSKPKKEAEKS